MPRLRLASLAAAGALTLCACTAPTASTGPATTTTTQSTITTTTQAGPTPVDSATASSTSTTSTGSAPGATPAKLPVLASRPFGGVANMSVQVNSVVVRDGVTTLTYSLTNSGKERFQVAASLSDGILQQVNGKAVDGDGLSADGTYLVDTASAQRYLVGRGPNGACVCDQGLAGAFIAPGESRSFSSVFKALPDAVTKVTVVVPGAGAFTDVPVTR